MRSVFPTPTAAETLFQGLVAFPPLRLGWPSSYLLTTNLFYGAAALIIWGVVAVFCSQEFERQMQVCFPCDWGMSLSCTVTVMLKSLFPQYIRKPVNTVGKQVMSGLSAFNYRLQILPVQIQHIIITSFISLT